MAFNWERAWRKAEKVNFSRDTVEADGRQFPQFVRDGFGSVFRFKQAGQQFVTFEKVGEPCCFKIFTPEMVVRNVARELNAKVENGELTK
jgi:hypothetical protein